LINFCFFTPFVVCFLCKSLINSIYTTSYMHTKAESTKRPRLPFDFYHRADFVSRRCCISVRNEASGAPCRMWFSIESHIKLCVTLFPSRSLSLSLSFMTFFFRLAAKEIETVRAQFMWLGLKNHLQKHTQSRHGFPRSLIHYMKVNFSFLHSDSLVNFSHLSPNDNFFFRFRSFFSGAQEKIPSFVDCWILTI
jgi:hypothetical protein